MAEGAKRRQEDPRERLVTIRATITFRVDEHNYDRPFSEADRRATKLWDALHAIDPRASWAWQYINAVGDSSDEPPKPFEDPSAPHAP